MGCLADLGVIMAIKSEHELHIRRRKSNLLLGLVLGGFVAIVFGVTIAKMKDGQMMEAFDHSLRSSLLEPSE